MPGSLVRTRSRRTRLGCAVGNDNLTGVLAESDPDAAAVMEGNPGSAANGIDERIEDRPIADCIRAVAHPFRFTVGGSYRTGIQVIATDHDRGLELRRLRPSH